MKITVGTFNLNNLFSRYNFKGEIKAIKTGDTTVAATGAIPSPQWEHLTHSDAVGAIPGGGTASTSAPPPCTNRAWCRRRCWTPPAGS